MGITPGELYTAVQGVVKEQEEYTQTLMYETLGIRWGEETLLAGVIKTVTLNQPFATGVVDYNVWRQVYESSDVQSEVLVTNKTETTFDVLAPRNCTLVYMTTFPSVTITP